MAKVYSVKQNPKLAIINALSGEPMLMRIGDQSFSLRDTNKTVLKFNDFWTLMDAVKNHGYLRAAMSVVGRSAVGAWWTLRKHDEYGRRATDRQRKRLYGFYSYSKKAWNNINDYYTIAAKLFIGVQYLRYFGQATYHVVRDEQGVPLGVDFLHGFVVPNVDSKGNFRSPAFIQYPSRDTAEKVEYDNPRDIVFVVNPDWEGAPTGGSDIEALSDYTLPLDIYLMTAAREYLKNRDRPEVVYSLPPDISDDAFDAFVKHIEGRHAGIRNIGRNPIAIQGDLKVTELRPLPAQLPYLESRQESRGEVMAVAGVPGSKLGLDAGLTNSNLREMRREFHETTLIPLFRVIEQAFYEQIHVREFDIDTWEFKFNSPDFLTAVERATVHMRYRQMGVLTPNEVRGDLGRQLRTDPEGDMFDDAPAIFGGEGNNSAPNGGQGSPPEGRPVEPDDPSQIGEPTMDDDPVRGDNHDDEPRKALLSELRVWRRFAINRLQAGKALRPFKSTVIPQEVYDTVSEYLVGVTDPSMAAALFDAAITEIEEIYDATSN